MHGLYALSRGRRPDVAARQVTLFDAEGAVKKGAIGLFAGPDFIPPGAFIGFYTGKWTARQRAYTGTNQYVMAYGDDTWYVCPQTDKNGHLKSSTKDAMAAINEPCQGVSLRRSLESACLIGDLLRRARHSSYGPPRKTLSRKLCQTVPRVAKTPRSGPSAVSLPQLATQGSHSKFHHTWGTSAPPCTTNSPSCSSQASYYSITPFFLPRSSSRERRGMLRYTKRRDCSELSTGERSDRHAQRPKSYLRTGAQGA